MTLNDLHIILELLKDCEHPSCSIFAHKLAKSMDVSDDTLKVLMDKPKETKKDELSTDEEKISFLIRLVRFLKSEVGAHQEDIKICQEIARKIGFEEGVIAELFLHVYSDPANILNEDSISFKVRQYRMA
ncbi:MAG: hypothetical protein AAF363_09265 [Bacteroidota bacterium]